MPLALDGVGPAIAFAVLLVPMLFAAGFLIAIGRWLGQRILRSFGIVPKVLVDPERLCERCRETVLGLAVALPLASCGCGVANALLPVGVPSLRPTSPLPEVDRWEVGGVEVTDAHHIERLKTVCRPRFWTPEVGTSPSRTLTIAGYRDGDRVVTRHIFGDRLLRGGYNDLTYARVSAADVEWLSGLAGTSEDEVWRNTVDDSIDLTVGGAADDGEDQW